MNYSTHCIKRHFNKACDYDKASALQQSIGKKLISLLQVYAHQTVRIIDIGCGTGITTQHLAMLFGYEDLHAIDVADVLLEKAKQRLSLLNVHCYEADFNCLPRFDYLFDVIFSNMALHWSENLTSTLEKLIVYLSAQGILAFSIPLQGTLRELQSDCAINHFANFYSIVQQLNQDGYHVIAEQHDTILSFNDPVTALQSIKNVGANFVNVRKRYGLRGKSFVRQIRLSQLTYRIGYFVVKKALPV